ncbi:hypothetical protein AcV7_010152 [Taiwanofungus camphoratus]|nr:hypothetical protein AcV7_010152 [Antrodia cinnamomea]
MSMTWVKRKALYGNIYIYRHPASEGQEVSISKIRRVCPSPVAERARTAAITLSIYVDVPGSLSSSDLSILEDPGVHRVQWTSPAGSSHYTLVDLRKSSVLSYFHTIPSHDDHHVLKYGAPALCPATYKVDAKIVSL